MSIIMSYHTLVERDSRFVGRRWQIMIIILLVGIAICNLVAAFKIHFLDENFEDNCFINSKIEFKTKKSGMQITKRFGRLLQDNKFDDEDQEFFDNVEIDKLESYWGNQNDCNFVSITPLFFCFCAVIWITIFLTCGHGGKSRSFVAGKPWKIVIPALVFFIAAAIATFILLVFLKSAIDLFCVELNQHLHSNYFCGFLLEQFSLLNQNDHKFSRDCYTRILEALILANVMWVVAAIIMILRIIFVIDFQLVRVTILSVEPTAKIDENTYEYKTDNAIKSELVLNDSISSTGPDKVRVSFDFS